MIDQPSGPDKSRLSPGKWTPAKIRRLRGQRTQEQFGKIIRVPKNTVWRWEAGYARPDSKRARRLSQLASKERFLQDWKLAGSAVLLGDIEQASRHLSRHFKISPRSIAAKWE
jgi:transcriptional regulator with XRE-family HTH domain